ncbi:MAG TPA: chemotaxis protein CheW [Terriglobia bacterium]|nr:chemotaxis protein CheW [Terriglobia bacterium]
MNQKNANVETYILFEIAGTTYGVSSQSVQQMEMVEHITPLPNAPPFVEGVVFTRGQVIPAVNLRSRFGFEKAPHTTRTRLVVTNHNGRMIGLIVDSAREFMSIPNNAVQPPPDSIAGLSGKYLKGIVTVDDRIVLIIELDELVNVGQYRASALEA